ncbi:MAG: hypothetical protein ABJ275_06975 [Maricaulaceae bacterium]
MLSKYVSSIKALSAALMLSLCCAAPSASAVSQDDIQACRTAVMEQGLYDISDYRLRFISEKGNRTRTIKLVAIPNNGGKRMKLTCRLNFKNKVVAINDHDLTKLAKK